LNSVIGQAVTAYRRYRQIHLLTLIYDKQHDAVVVRNRSEYDTACPTRSLVELRTLRRTCSPAVSSISRPRASAPTQMTHWLFNIASVSSYR